MPVTVHLDDLLRQRGMTLTELAGRIGLTVANLSILKTNKARALRFSTLDAICRELGCQPGDILTWEPSTPVAVDAPGENAAGPAADRGWRPPVP
jgi:putative transcriptional regulator